ncbi:hypothetical protein [uncultured Pseudacidovorax sp.]|uniref:hypothetical protein n=1 Tax=uncultured Pseudacidovorax sp. TaxID=679313 RepID=UPI0025F5ACEE|nr:hypothetical protein [uncultured Pseudacidovorax sp.]
MSSTFRHKAGFGKRIEYWVVGLMLKQGMDVYMPLVDDDAIDAVIKRPDGQFIQIQIKARSKDVKAGDGALFSAITHELRESYFFVLYSERHDKIWILSSREFLANSHQNINGVNAGKRSIWLNGKKKSKITGLIEEHIYERFNKFEAIGHDLSRLLKNGVCTE